MQSDSIAGAILGCAVGDAIGLPYEGLSKRRGIRLLGEPIRHRFVFRRGMVSDDTEHTCMVGQALCEHPTDPKAFVTRFGRHLRWWLLGLPAGIGSATLRAILKLWIGFSPQRSGVFSAGNGPAMRSAILGASIENLETLKQFVRASTLVTHTDPKAYQGAFAVALAAWCSRHEIHGINEYFGKYQETREEDPDSEFASLMKRVEESLASGEATLEFARKLGCERGVSGYVFRTVPVAIHCWLSHPRDFETAVSEVIRCGGDTDTTAAIVGAIIGSGVGSAGIPQAWLTRIWEWPRSVDWMKRLAKKVEEAVQSGQSVRPPRLLPMVGLFRNLLFLGIVLTHVIRRIFPPY